MKLQNQVSSLELSKKLKELGVPQESLFYWFHKLGMGIDEECNQKIREDYGWKIKDSDCGSKNSISAFTVAELGEMLPNEVNLPFKNGKPRKINNVLKSYFGNGVGDYKKVIYAKPPGVGESLCEVAETEADARAKMLIYLLENKLFEI